MTPIGIAGPANAMVGRTVDYMVVPGEAITYQWRVEGGEIITGQNSQAISVKWTDKGAHNIEVAVERFNGSVTKANYPVKVDRG